MPCQALISLDHLQKFINKRNSKYIIILDDIEMFKQSPQAQIWLGAFLNLSKETKARRLNA